LGVGPSWRVEFAEKRGYRSTFVELSESMDNARGESGFAGPGSPDNKKRLRTVI